MNLEEMKKLISDAYYEFMQKRHNIHRMYAEEHNPVKLGDTICDSGTTMKVNEMKLSHYNDFPEMTYKGVELRKDGKPKKKQEGYTIFQSCIKSINGNPYEFENPCRP